jgi:hypothetical protein
LAFLALSTQSTAALARSELLGKVLPSEPGKIAQVPESLSKAATTWSTKRLTVQKVSNALGLLLVVELNPALSVALATVTTGTTTGATTLVRFGHKVNTPNTASVH